MTTPTAAYPRKVQIAPDSAGSAGTYADLGGQMKADLSDKMGLIDVTQLASSGQVSRLATLSDSSLKLDVLYDSADTAQGSLRSGKSGRTQVWVKFFLTATTGLVVPMYVESFDYSLAPNDANKVSVSLSQSGGAALTTF